MIGIMRVANPGQKISSATGDSMRNLSATPLAATALALALISQGLSLAQAAPGSHADTGSSGGTWGNAIEIPGLARLNAGGGVDLSAVSCTSSGNCGAGGSYGASNTVEEGFVVTQRGGVWGEAMEVPGLGRLNTGSYASVDTLSCSAAGDCSAGGQYTARHDQFQAWVATERHGVWGRAIEVPGSARLDVAGGADIGTMSCTRPGDCTAGGEYGVSGFSGGASQALVVTERKGVWGRAIEVPGTGRLNYLGQAEVESVSCAAPGDCSAGGYYLDRHDNQQAFVVTQRGGRWGRAVEVRGSARLIAGGGAIESVSCTRVGYCSAGGDLNGEAVVVTQRDGRWGRAVEVPGSARLNSSGDAEVESVSCAAPGDCSGGGYYSDGDYNTQAFVVTERWGRWGKAIEVPGSGRLNTTGMAEVDAVSCAAAGDCSAGGDYSGADGNSQAFVVTERDGRWGRVIEVPGSARLNTGGDAETEAVSCTAPGHCSAAGEYANGKGGIDLQGFVVTEN
jgi:hypothetical protein